MGPVEILIYKAAQSGHPLAVGIAEVEVPHLIEALRIRIGATSAELDLSPGSLDRLTSLLERLPMLSGDHQEELDQDGMLRLVRELMAYLGTSMLNHTNGKWQSGTSITETEIIYPGPVETAKDGQVRTYPKSIYSLANIAGSICDAVRSGVRPQLQWLIRDVKVKRKRERL